MAKIVQYKCDRCGQLTEKPDGWFSMRIGPSGTHSRVNITIGKLLDDTTGDHFCGEGCVSAELSVKLEQLHGKNGHQVKGGAAQQNATSSAEGPAWNTGPQTPNEDRK